jgi:ABC-2 type transport system permease protein
MTAVAGLGRDSGGWVLPEVGATPSTVRVGIARGWGDFRSYLRTPVAVAFGWGMPLALMVIFSSIYSGNASGTSVPLRQTVQTGLIASAIFSSAWLSTCMGIAFEREDGTIDRLRSTPFSAASYVIAKSMFALLSSAVQLVLAMGVACLALGLPAPVGLRGWGVLILVELATVATTVPLALAIGVAIPGAKNAAPILNFPFLLLQFCSGVFYAYGALPTGLRWLGAAFPLKWIAQAIRYSVFVGHPGAAGGSGWQLPLTALVLAAWWVGSIVLAVAFLRGRRVFR